MVVAEKLRENGLLGNIQGPMNLESKVDFLSYIEQCFNEDCSKSVYPDEVQEQLFFYCGRTSEKGSNR